MAALLAGAYGLEYLGGMEPCPLCIFQRLVVLGLTVVFLAAALHDPRGDWGSRVYGVLTALVALIGMGIAGRHLWLQSLPPEDVPACGPGLDYMVETMPLTQTLTNVLTGSGQCAEVEPVLGLPIPVWTMAAFVAALVWGLGVNWPRSRG
jgi:disulfide bond formation protein DsbB